MIEIRPTLATDADGLCDAHVDGWRVGYRGIFPDSFLDADEFESQRRERWHRARWLESSDTTMFAALLDGRVVGFADVGPQNIDEQPTGRGEVYGFYLHPTAWGSGTASAMMRRGEDDLRERGFDDAVLWVLRDNPRARRFYEKAGWQCSGEESIFEVSVDGEPLEVADVLYERSLR